MGGTFESSVLLHGGEAEKAIVILKEKGEDAALEYLRQWHEPGEGTLVSSRDDPWKPTDQRFEQGSYVVYYDLHAPYIGLVNRVIL